MKLKKLFPIKLIALVLFGASLNASEELYPRVRPQNDLVLPKKFRTLENLHASGSGQFSEKSLEQIINNIPNPNIILIDLRRELHGFINGYAVSWKLKEFVSGDYEYNREFTSKQIEEQEVAVLEELLQKGTFTCATDDSSIVLTSENVMTERQLAEKMGFSYFRFPVMDHERPSDTEVDAFVTLIKALPADHWIHLHCAAGEGRTTTFMSMLDMIYNSQLLGADEIMQRQQTSGGSNLWNPEEVYRNHHPIRLENAKKRREFLLQFHQYCLENPDFSTSWSDWNSK